jgi:quercetin dioxygenase-like cupin family protein
MELLTQDQFKVFANPGVTSVQIVSPHNSRSERVTITRVTVAPGASQPRHAHAGSEQIWIALEGKATLLLADDETRAFGAGEAARFADGDQHGVENGGADPFVYLSVTSPPIDFAPVYRERS